MGFIDLRMLLKWYAKAISKHINFSEGYLFVKDKVNSASLQNERLQFTYDLKNMKIDLNQGKKIASDKDISQEETKANIDNISKMNITIQDSELLDTIGGDKNPKEVENEKEIDWNSDVRLWKVSSEAIRDPKNSEIFNAQNDMNKDSFISSFLTNKEGRSSMQSYGTSAFDSSLQYSNTAISFNNLSSRPPMEVIESVGGDTLTISEKEKDDASDDQDDFDRYEEIDVKNVGLETRDTPSKDKKQKAILTPEQIAQAHQERENENLEDEKIEWLIKWKELIETGHFTIDDFKENEENKEFSEGYKILNKMTEKGLKNNLETQLLKCHQNYSFDTESMLDLSMPTSSLALKEMYVSEKPTQEEIYYYSKYIVLSSRMEKEIPLVSLAYLERLWSKTGILINHWNWRRLMLISLTVASKIWDDESLENVHFPKAMADVSLKEINNLEKLFLDLIDYDLMVRGADYAKYYFILRSISKEFEDPENVQMDPITVEHMQLLQKNSDKAEEILRGIYKNQDFSASI